MPHTLKLFFFSSRRRHTRWPRDWSSDVCSSDLIGETNGDFVWPMPLVDEYDETLKSDYADFSNISSQSSGGSITAALFLRRFVPKSAKWIHVDMAGVMESKSKGYYGKSATGFGARLLADYAVKVSQN